MTVSLENTKQQLSAMTNQAAQSADKLTEAVKQARQNAVDQQAPVSQYQTVERILQLPVTKQSLQLYQDRVEPAIEWLPLGGWALRQCKSVVNYTLPVCARVAEPYHKQLDSTGMRIVDVAEQVGTAAVQTEVAVLSRLDGAVSLVERAVDYVLPPLADENDLDLIDDQDEEEDEGVAHSDKILTGSSSSNGSSQQQQQPAPFKHAYSVTTKTGHRLMAKVTRIAHESEQSLNLKHTLDVVNQYSEHLMAATVKLRESVAQSQQFLSESIEKRVGTKEDREKLLDSTKTYLNEASKPTMQVVMAAQHKLVESVTEVKIIIRHVLSSLFKSLDKLPFGVKQKVEVLMTGLQERFEKVSASLQSPSQIVKDGEETVESMVASLRSMTSRATDLNALSSDALDILGRVRGVVQSYYAYSVKQANKVLSTANKKTAVEAEALKKTE